MSAISEQPASVSSHAGAPTEPVPIPKDALIIVPVRNTVLFPGVVAPITVAAAEAGMVRSYLDWLQLRDPAFLMA